MKLYHRIGHCLKLVSCVLKPLANHSSAFPVAQFACNSCKCIYTIKKGVLDRFSSSLVLHFEAPLPKHRESHIYFFVESTSLSSNFVLFAAHSDVALHRHNGKTISSSTSVSTMYV